MTESNLKRIYQATCLLIILLVLAIRLHLANIPFERDEGEYAYAGQMILRGVPPYQEVYNMKFPGVYFMYALAFKLFGEGVAAPRYMVILLQLISASFIFLLARRILNPLAAWMAATVFIMFSLTIALQGTQSNAEHFVVAFLTSSVFFLYVSMESASLPEIILSGFLLGTACLMKQHSVVFTIAAGSWIIYMQRLKSIKYLASYAVGFIIPISLMFFYMKNVGVWDHFYFLTVQYAKAYIGVVPVHKGIQTINPMYRESSAFSALLIWFASISIVSLLIPKQNTKTRLFLLLLLVVSLIAVCPGLYFRRHYFLMTLPVGALLFTNTAFLLSGYFNAQYRYLVLALFLALNATFFFVYDYDYFFKLQPEQITEEMYPGSPFPISGRVAEYIKNHSAPSDRICMVGVEPQLFFLSQRRSASGYIYIYPLLENQRYEEAMTDEFTSQSERSKPAIMVYTSVSIFDETFTRHERLFKWFNTFKKQYKLVAISTPINANSIQLSELDTLAPMDTFDVHIPQVRIYERIKN